MILNHIIYIGLGSNMGERMENLRLALKKISGLKGVEVKAISSFYETEPVIDPHYDHKGKEYPWFINAAVVCHTSLTPYKISPLLRSIENDMGRKRLNKNEPRIIDLDLLLYGDLIIDRKDLVIPHPRLHLRRFVIMPLLELNEALVHPVFKVRLSEILAGLDSSIKVEKI